MAVPTWEVDRLVTVVPPDPIMLRAAPAEHHLDDLTVPAALADVGALHDDSVTRVCVHGEPPYSEVGLSSKPRPLAGTNQASAGARVSTKSAPVLATSLRSRGGMSNTGGSDATV